MPNLSPFPWRPTADSNAGSDVLGTPIPGGQVDAGDWCQVTICWHTGAVVAHRPGQFFIHAIYTPNSDDSTPHPDTATTYGGFPNARNRRPNYHIDPGWWFQAPSSGQISVIAGGDSSEVEVGVLLRRQHAPRDGMRLAEQLRNKQADVMRRALEGDPEAVLQLAGFSPVSVPKADRIWPPPIIGTPQLVPATWIQLEAAPAGAPISFPDGAVKMTTVSAAVIAPVRFNITTLGVAFPVDVAPGIPLDIGQIAQGAACSDGVASTWIPTANVQTVTIWSSLGG